MGFADDIEERLARCSALIATTPCEAFGLTVVEAMARSTPVLATASGAHLETVGGVSDRWLFPPGEPDALAELLNRLPQAEEDLAEYGSGLQVDQRARFSPAAHAAALLDLYRGLTSR